MELSQLVVLLMKPSNVNRVRLPTILSTDFVSLTFASVKMVQLLLAHFAQKTMEISAQLATRITI